MDTEKRKLLLQAIEQHEKSFTSDEVNTPDAAEAWATARIQTLSEEIIASDSPTVHLLVLKGDRLTESDVLKLYTLDKLLGIDSMTYRAIGDRVTLAEKKEKTVYIQLKDLKSLLERK